MSVDFPPSLRNIFQEVQSETGAPMPSSGDLTRWARQGVFLLNTCLSVRAHQAFSHSGQGWETFTDAVIRRLSEEREGLVFMLWGAPAGKKDVEKLVPCGEFFFTVRENLLCFREIHLHLPFQVRDYIGFRRGSENGHHTTVSIAENAFGDRLYLSLI